MKSLLCLLLVPAMVVSQETAPNVRSFHQHTGFYLSLCAGPGFGKINLDANNTTFNTMSFQGFGMAGDFKIGGAVAENVLVSFDIIDRSVSEPELDVDGTKIVTPTDTRAGDVSYNLGLTYYIMPANIFLSGSMGFGVLRLIIDNSTSRSETGLALHFKIGKEWWVSKNWGLGLSVGFGYVGAQDKGDPLNPAYNGRLSTKKAFIMFNSTYN